MAETIIIGLIPPLEVESKIHSLRKKFSEYTENSKYSFHQPHITLYMNSFISIPHVQHKLEKICKNISSFKIKVTGISKFPKDPVTGETVWIFKVSNQDILKQLRNLLIEELSSIKTSDHANWMFNLNPNYSNSQKENVLKYATPISPDDFRFHLTIFSTTKELHKDQFENIQIEFEINNISILKGDGEKFVVYKNISLN